MAKMRYRKFCKTCNEYQVFDETETDELICSICKTMSATVELTDIPNNKILEQRQRYKDHYLENFMDSIKSKDSVINKAEIIMEDDAGLMLNKDFKKTLHATLAKELYTYREEIRKETISRKKYPRNKTCYCGSGKKYKICCLGTVK